MAKQAGAYEGSETENTIDVYKSYCAYANGSPNTRLVNGLNYFLASDTLSASTIAPEDFTISNVKNGKVVSLYTNIQNKLGKISIHDMVDYYKVDDIANIGNLEWHIFQIQSADAPETGHHRVVSYGARPVLRGHPILSLSDHRHVRWL